MRPGAAKRTGSKRGPSRFGSVLVPVDLTPSSDRLLGRLSLLPLDEQARVILLHVVPGSLRPADRRDAERDAEHALVSEARHLRKSLPGTVRVETVVKVGAAAQVIAACAKKERADLIVMGRGGRNALRDAFIGSSAERVIRHARVPVLVVRRPARAAYRRPALALDLDEVAREVIGLALTMLPPPRPHVEIIHSYDIPYGGLIYPSLVETGATAAKRVMQRRRARELERLLAEALAAAHVTPEDAPSWNVHVRYGSPQSAVEKVTGAARTDLLVLGTHGYSGAAYAFLGTVAGGLLRAAKCDVLIVPPAPSSRGGGGSVKDRAEE